MSFCHGTTDDEVSLRFKARIIVHAKICFPWLEGSPAMHFFSRAVVTVDFKRYFKLRPSALSFAVPFASKVYLVTKYLRPLGGAEG